MKIDNGNLFARRFKHDFSVSMVINVRGEKEEEKEKEKGRKKRKKKRGDIKVEKLYMSVLFCRCWDECFPRIDSNRDCFETELYNVIVVCQPRI